ncbi:hypothetical protein EVAR_96240_1 [Eumeta japonica]|uniref:Uncharacterized protein n=1 Tax=Eumeta variegata TaxID=151549 RepID=A0A4C1WNE2_EUMVA|nr:hypothetical protein EVAR_96240_1 [Eumeta japonica]
MQYIAKISRRFYREPGLLRYRLGVREFEDVQGVTSPQTEKEILGEQLTTKKKDNLGTKDGLAALLPCRRSNLGNCLCLLIHITIKVEIKSHPHFYTLDCPCGRSVSSPLKPHTERFRNYQ